MTSKFLSWHLIILSCHWSSFIYLDIHCIFKGAWYLFHRKYLSWHSIIVIFILTLHPFYILSWHPLQFWRIIHINLIEYIYLDNELFYLDIQVLLSILTSITRSMSINLMGFIHLDIIILFILIFTSITVSRSMLLNVIWCIYLDIKPLLHLILTSIQYAYLDIQFLSWGRSDEL